MRYNPCFRSSFAFIALSIIACLSQALADENSFNGKWIYEQTCGWKHVASINLHQEGGQVNGDWSDGSARASGTSGQLQGVISGNKLALRYCGVDENSDSNVCPSFDPDASDYFVRQGKDIVWYKMSIEKNGSVFRKYLVLHPVIDGKPAMKDRNCSDE